MNTYIIKCELLNGLKKVVEVKSNHIEQDVREIEELQDAVGQPIMSIEYQRVS